MEHNYKIPTKINRTTITFNPEGFFVKNFILFFLIMTFISNPLYAKGKIGLISDILVILSSTTAIVSDALSSSDNNSNK